MILKHLVAATIGLASIAATAAGSATASDYPLHVRDLAGREVTIPAEPQRIVLQDGRDIWELALLDRADPVRRIVTWNNILMREDPASFNVIAGKWPQARSIPDMGFGDDGQVNAEQLIASRPDLVVIQQRALGSFVQAGLDKRLAQLNIPLIAIDTFNAPVPGATQSVALLGKVLNRETEAAAYTSFYDTHLKRLRDTVAASGRSPRVFVEVLAGREGPEQCCFTHGKAGWGLMVEAIGAHNIGSELVTGAAGNVTLETVIARKPDVYVETGRMSTKAGTAFVPLGYGADKANIDAAMGVLARRPGMEAIKAITQNRIVAIWHLFYSHPYNIVGLEWLAKFAFPEQFRDLDPAATYQAILSDFTQLPATPFRHAEAAN